ncbi:MAG: tyrosine-type recombinase/integrase [Gaiellaceae bacterium]
MFDVRAGTKIRRSFPTHAAAKAWRADATVSVRRGAMVAASRVTVREAAEAFVDGARDGVVLTRNGKRYKPSAIRSYDRDLDRFVLPDLGALRLSDVRRRDVQALVDRLVGAGFSGSTVRNIVTPLQAIYRRALQDDEIAVNPVTTLRLPEQSGARERVASPVEAAVLLAALPEADRPLWATALYAGLRRGELRALRVEDVDLAAGLIRVSRGWDDVEGPIEPKSRKGTREVPLSATLREILTAHLLATGRRGSDLVFGRTASAPFVPKLVRERALRAWAAAAVGAFLSGRPLVVEIAPIGLHECRHTFVSLMHAAGRSLEEIGDYVGHSSTYMTDRYRHLLDGARTEAAAALDAYLATAST